jgi:hypothetical protein
LTARDNAIGFLNLTLVLRALNKEIGVTGVFTEGRTRVDPIVDLLLELSLFTGQVAAELAHLVDRHSDKIVGPANIPVVRQSRNACRRSLFKCSDSAGKSSYGFSNQRLLSRGSQCRTCRTSNSR